MTAKPGCWHNSLAKREIMTAKPGCWHNSLAKREIMTARPGCWHNSLAKREIMTARLKISLLTSMRHHLTVTPPYPAPAYKADY